VNRENFQKFNREFVVELCFNQMQGEVTVPQNDEATIFIICYIACNVTRVRSNKFILNPVVYIVIHINLFD
jgi:hypothetical protein